ncbi:hypothetical protein MTR_2g012840 [Medicago truncatula]|uniref:Uncharacterized protein n=1 Tax=Medicago truncatula TaxID=3880 RepID=G7INY8_MEDTR|nr:hypothetical protein MTR_2g012840 [Medicago truncatula]
MTPNIFIPFLQPRKYTHTLVFRVPPRLELGLLDSESNVLTARPWDHCCFNFW